MEQEDIMSDLLIPPMDLMGLQVTLMPISDIFTELPSFKLQIERYHPVKSASFVAGLLTDPSFHANALRIELLIHLLMAFAEGTKRPSIGDLNSWLNSDLGSTAFAHMEDPVEDVFITSVITKDGNIRIFEGVWESSDFYLQRLLNIIDTLPENQDTNQLRRHVRAVLLLSEQIACRLQLERFCQGGGMDKGVIRVPSSSKLKLLHQAITFTPDELKHLNINQAELMPFIFWPGHRDKLREQIFGENELIKRPIVKDADNYFVLLPSAISVAVRQHILEWMISHGYQDSFNEHLAIEYQDFFHETPLLGSPFPLEMPMPPKKCAGKTILDITRKVDEGRYLHLLAIVDGIKGYMNHGFSLPDNDPTEISDQLEKRIKSIQEHFLKLDGFKQGLTLLIGCGYGRPYLISQPKESEDWRVEFVSAPDFKTLAWIPGESPLMIWKLIDHQRFLTNHQVEIVNASGLLNLYGWWVDSNYLMLHPDIEFPSGQVHLAIPTDSLANIRKKVRQGWDLHALPFPNGTFVRVQRKSAESYFPDESNKEQYAAIEEVRAGSLMGSWKGEKYIWWLLVDNEKTDLSRDVVYRIWDAIINWFELAVPVFENHCQKLQNNVVLIILDFNNAHSEQEEPVAESVLWSSISVSSDKNTNAIRVTISDPFFAGFRNPKNIAERILLSAITAGVLELAGKSTDEKEIDDLIQKIVPDDNARYVHFFEAVHFSELIQHYDKPKKLFIDDADVARSKLGLGWLVHNKSDGDSIVTSNESVRFLNDVVDVIWKKMKIKLQNLDRENFIKRALWHIEGIEAEREIWQRTIRAVMALRSNKDATRMVAMKHIARCNAAKIALRLISEMAISECPLKGGKEVGKLDLTPLMSDVMMMFHLGGCSDAIKKSVMEPEIKIAPCGDVLTHVGFRNDVVTPFTMQYESASLDYESENYEKHYKEFEPVLTVKGIFKDFFLEAFEEEFGFSFDTLRGFRESLENLAFERKSCVFVASKVEILAACVKTGLTSSENAKIILAEFSLWPRKSWNNTPKGFESVDWYPWRFGRQLSLIRRPLVCIEEGTSPRYVISPGLFGQGIVYTTRRYYEAEIEATKCKSISMKEWINKETMRKGHAFEQVVYEKIKNLGYKALLDQKVTALINNKLDQDYGDVDVFAWKPSDNIVFAIECKDLKMAKTPNEIAEQLNRFSGQILPNGERDDLLKHLDRCNIMKNRCTDIAKTIGYNGKKINIRGVVCFSEPVPMQYVASRFPDILFVTIDNIISVLS
jgi:hypothetical protein